MFLLLFCTSFQTAQQALFFIFFIFGSISEAHRITCTKEFAKSPRTILDPFATYPELKVVVTKLIPQEKGEETFGIQAMCSSCKRLSAFWVHGSVYSQVM